MTYLSAGCPILGLVENRSELGRMISKHKLGIVPNLLSGQSIKHSVLNAYELRNKNFSRAHIKTASKDLFDKEKVIQAWCDVLRDFLEKTPRLPEAPLSASIERFASKAVS